MNNKNSWEKKLEYLIYIIIKWGKDILGPAIPQELGKHLKIKNGS